MKCPECGKEEFIIEIVGTIEYKDFPVITYMGLNPRVPQIICKNCKTIIHVSPDTAVNLEEEIQKKLKIDCKVY